jgi:fatty acid/phospholipid biosynthesis enzyme
MENKKETAVEWLEDIIKGSIQDKLVIAVLTPIFQQAKEMEKDQVVNAYLMGVSDEGIKSIHTKANAEEFYKETYEKSNI